MHYKFVFKKGGKVVLKEEGDEGIEGLAKRLDSVVVKMK